MVALAFRDAAIPVAAQLLVYPCVDLTRGPEYPSLAENAHGYILTASDLDACLKAYINDDPAVAKQFTPSPLRAADHRGLAPAVIGQGDNDALRDLTLASADVLQAAGVTVRCNTQNVYGTPAPRPLSTAPSTRPLPRPRQRADLRASRCCLRPPRLGGVARDGLRMDDPIGHFTREIESPAPQLGGCRTAIVESGAREVRWLARAGGAPGWPRAGPAAGPVRWS